jgi:hypothetical protein
MTHRIDDCGHLGASRWRAVLGKVTNSCPGEWWDAQERFSIRDYERRGHPSPFERPVGRCTAIGLAQIPLSSQNDS